MRAHVDSWYSSSSHDSNQDDALSESSDCSLDDDDTINTRVTPYWPNYRKRIESCGYHLDTYRDVREFYERYWEGLRLKGESDYEDIQCGQGYLRACSGCDDDLCKDAGLPENLFRGTRISDGKKAVIKAVCLRSREYEVIRILSSPPLCDNPMNQTIPVLDLIEVPEDEIAFIVQEEWSPQLVSGIPCSLHDLLSAVRQCIMGLAFMHTHNIAHLDVSLTNILTDELGHYKYIDFEQSRYFPGIHCPRIRGCRGTEIPPEVERGEDADPYKIDVWALGVLIFRACQTRGNDIPELVALTLTMLRDNFEARPSAKELLQAFDTIIPRINETHLMMSPD